MSGRFIDIQKPLNLNITIDSSKLNLTYDIKVQVNNAIENQLDFALMDDDGLSGALFLKNRYMVTTFEGELSFTLLTDQQALLNSVSIAILTHRVFTPIDKLLSFDQQKVMAELAYMKTKLL
jgi:hypothetical protein